MAPEFISAGVSENRWNNLKAPVNFPNIMKIGTFYFDAKQTKMKRGALACTSILTSKLIFKGLVHKAHDVKKEYVEVQL